MCSRPYRIRLSNSGDRRPILSLLKHWRTLQPIEARYRWIYDGNPHGRALSWVAEDCASGQVVGCISCFPRRLCVRGSIVLGSVGGDSFVHRDWRRMGIATALHTLSHKDLPRVGLAFNYGFAGSSNGRALKRAGAVELGAFRRLVLPLSAKAVKFAPAAIAGRILRRWETRTKGRAGPSLDELSPDCEKLWQELESLWEEARQAFPISLVREASYFRWRYAAAPGERPLLFGIRRRGTLEGFAAVTRSGSRYEIFDFFAREKETARHLLALLGAALQERGAELVAVVLSPRGPDCRQTFRRMGFIGREPVPFALYVVPQLDLREQMSDPRAWYITKADLD